MSDLRKLASDLPYQPGVYLWKDDKDRILYVGKAKELRKRVMSYLRKRLDRKTWELMQRARDLETIVVNTEREALLLEAELIRKHQPKYNLALKDDRRYGWIRVDCNCCLPTFHVTRDIERDGATYYGPYGSTKRVIKFLDTARKFIPIAMCADPEKEKRACMDYHLERCAGPCEEHVSEEEYRSMVNQMCLYIEGRAEELKKLITSEMEAASKKMEFEKAATLRDRLDDIEIIMRKHSVYTADGDDQDILGISRTEQASLIEMLIIRGGRLIGSENFYFEVGLDVPDVSILTTFVEQYYFTMPKVPDEIILSKTIPDMEILAGWLKETVGTNVKFTVPKDGKKLELVEMAGKNAYRSLRKILILDESEDQIVNDAIKELKHALQLEKAPFHIEGFDIANIQGTDPTGSCVVFRNGEPNKKSYRMFKVRIKETPDDYAMMHEVVYRRYKGVLERGDEMPDLVLIDGGKGQLNVALEALEELGLEYLNAASLAKREEILFTRDLPEGVALKLDSNALHLVQRIRDEAHRFAQRYHHKLREKRFSGSILEEVPGIGKKRRVALIRHFGSYEQVCNASVEELASVLGMSQKVAENLRSWLDREASA